MEIWKDVEGYEGIYQVSNLGRILRVDFGRFLKGTTAWNGYIHIGLSNNGKVKHIGLHQVVAAAFIGSCPEGMEVNHIDTNKANNQASNLEYLTHSDNQKHAYKMGRTRTPKGETHPTTYFKNEDIQTIKQLRADGLSEYKIAALYNAPRTTIQSILNGKSWSHIAPRSRPSSMS